MTEATFQEFTRPSLLISTPVVRRPHRIGQIAPLSRNPFQGQGGRRRLTTANASPGSCLISIRPSHLKG